MGFLVGDTISRKGLYIEVLYFLDLRFESRIHRLSTTAAAGDYPQLAGETSSAPYAVHKQQSHL